MASSSSLETDRLRLACEVLARGVIRCRRDNVGEGAETLRCAATEIAGDEKTSTAARVEEDGR
jgi:hypothetical protein